MMDLTAQTKVLRQTIFDMILNAGGGHIAPAFSCAEIVTALYFKILNVDPKNPEDPERDRFVLSKGHGCAALYAALALREFFPMVTLDTFCKPGGILGGHPDRSVPGIEVSSGSLGHGLSLGVGMALAARLDKRLARTFVLMSDGECHEGSVWEAAQAASHYQLDNLTVVLDYNKQISLGQINDIIRVEPLADRWTSFGWAVKEVDGHNVEQLADVLSTLPTASNQPSLILAHTVKGKGISFMEGVPIWHYRVPTGNELEQARRELK
jgi:transketolase